MEFLAGPNGPIIPDPESAMDIEQMARSQRAVEFFRANIDRVAHFRRRVDELGRSGHDTVITLLSVDDPIGALLAEHLMPGHDWQQYRDAGEIPVARGLAVKDDFIPGFLKAAGYTNASAELSGSTDLKVVVLAEEVALILDADLES